MGTRTFASDASIVLIGIRGTGRSTLAILAASSLGFRLVDTDAVFHKTTGLSRWAFARKYGHEACQRAELDSIRTTLDQNPTKSVIVCGLGSVHKSGQQLLLEFSRAHPVIYIMRDNIEVANHLQCSNKAIEDVVELGNPTFRALSNYEFYNLPDATLTETDITNDSGRPPSLILKKIERDFLELVLRIRGWKSSRMGHAQTALSQLPLETRPFTYALSLPLISIPDVSKRLAGVDLMADAIELVLDFRDTVGNISTYGHITATYISKLFYTLRRSIRLPIIFHIQLPHDSSHPSSRRHGASLLQSSYLSIVEHGLRLAPEFLTLDLHLPDEQIQAIIAQKGRTKVIGNLYDGSPGPDSWACPTRKTLIGRAEKLGCDLVRICQPATSRADNISVQQFTHYARTSARLGIPLIAYNTGQLGRMSCFLNRILTPVTHPLLQQQDATLDDEEQRMPTIPEALNALYASCFLDAMKFGIFGSDVLSSLSPFLHNAAFAHCGMPHIYKTFQSSSLSSFASLLEDPSFGGASITAPFKADIIPILDHLSPAAEAIGAVNTVLPLRSNDADALLDRSQRGKIVALYGENTDWIGIHDSIRRNLSPINAVTSRTTGLILGAGGMAHAAVYSMICLGVRNIYVWNRTRSKAEKLAQRFSGRMYPAQHTGLDAARPMDSDNSQYFGPSTIYTVFSLEEVSCGWNEPPNVIVSCIPTPTLTIPSSWLASKTGGVLIELAYIPLETPLLAQVRKLAARGWIAIDGPHTLQAQAISQFELFTGRKAPEKFIRSEMDRRHLEMSNVNTVESSRI
ncbi:putative Quinate repressor protein [Seiridium cardinale]